MDEKNSNGEFNLKDMFLGVTSLFTSLLAIVYMYYIFASVSVITALIGIGNKNTRSISILSLSIVVISFVLKMLNYASINFELPAWLTSGMF